MKLKPTIYFKYYRKSRRGWWCVSLMPHPHALHFAAWQFAHKIKQKLNEVLDAEYAEQERKREYARQLKLRVTT